MKTHCSVFFMVLVLCVTSAMFPVAVMAAPPEEMGSVFSSSNGDRYTAFNLQWDNGESGSISFDIQQVIAPNDMVTEYYIVYLYRDGEMVGSNYIRAADFSGTHLTADVSEKMDAPGTYFFTVIYGTMSTYLEPARGEVSRSPEYVKGPGPDAVPIAEMIGSTSETANGDGYTPYNVRWSNPATGEIAHDVQRAAGRYRIWVYRNNEIIGSSGTGYAPGYDPYPNSYTTSLATFLTEPATYHFTVQYVNILNGLEQDDEGLEVRSPDYVYGGAASSSIMGDPSNLRMEIVNNEEIMFRWDAPSDWVEGRDSFVIWAYSMGGGPGSTSATDGAGSSMQTFPKTTEYLYDLPTGKMGDRQNIDVQEGTWEGPYIFSVQSVSGNTDIAASGVHVFSTMAYDRNQGIIAWNYAGLASNQRVDGNATVSAPAAAPAVSVETPQRTAGQTASPTASSVYVDGAEIEFDAYNIGGNNYFKLRDLAYVLNGTAAQFEVGWDSASNAINLTSGQTYSGANEMGLRGGAEKTAAPTAANIIIDGNAVSLTAYNIDGNNYFMLRDIGSAFDFRVEWDGDSNAIVIDTRSGY